ncbi:TetR/AcrR family transcriptional regulator [Agromyces lapidis]|uniref:TetR/AcrR family transcriptional regulator n=1 Tax=Agromyces lapidis TaxID=279574 RepID=A0ABV5SUA5_9MICO|nr:TetR family transcriptional regulator [Agromyces lapidis]
MTQANRSRAEATRHRLTEVALDLFERDGFDRTTTASIAAAAGVSEMTFFRHFGTKQGVLFDDPYDPAIVHAIAGRREGPLLRRITEGMRQAWAELPEPAEAQVRRRIAIVATTPELRAGMRANMERTEDAVVGQLVADGSNAFDARVAAASVMSGVAAGLLEWAASSDGRLHDRLMAALTVAGGADRD